VRDFKAALDSTIRAIVQGRGVETWTGQWTIGDADTSRRQQAGSTGWKDHDVLSDVLVMGDSCLWVYCSV
jgi:hypothetical protein